MNPTGLIPTSVTDANGNAYAVFTPADGGTFSDDASGATVTAEPGAVPDQTLIAVRAETLPASDAGYGGLSGRFTLAPNPVRVTAADAQGEVLTTYRFDEAIQVCTPIPVEFLARLDVVTLVRLPESAGSLTVLGSTVFQGGSTGLRICGAVSQLPATVAVARMGVTPTATPGPGPDIGEIETGGGAIPAQRTLLWLAAIALLTASATAVVTRFRESPAKFRRSV